MNTIKVIETFKNEDICIDYLCNLRWEKMRVCPYCNATTISKHIEKNRKSRLQCSKCNKSFSPTVNTIMHNTHVPLFKWFLAISLLSEAKKSISSRQLSRHLDLPVKTAYSMSQRIRKALLGTRSPLLKGIIEIDETYIGGKPRFPNNGAKRGRGTKKTMVVGMVERGGNVIASVPEVYKQKNVRDMIIENIDLSNAEIHTDEYKVYNRVGNIAEHKSVNHGLKQYSCNGVHTNSAEGYWALVKRAWYGQHHHYSKKFTPLYIAEASFKFNNRKNPSELVFTNLLNSMLTCTPS